jgi:hypothetical protein
MNKKYNNNNIIIASRAYFLQKQVDSELKMSPRSITPVLSGAVHCKVAGAYEEQFTFKFR